MANPGLRAEVEAMVLTAVERGGPAIDRAAIVAHFGDRIPRATLYRWIGAPLRDGRAGARVAADLRQAVARRAERSPDPTADVVAEAAQALPVPLGIGEVMGRPAVEALRKIIDCVRAAEDVMRQARGADGDRVRMPKMLLAASDSLRRSLETAVRLHAAILEVQAIEAMHAELLSSLEDVHRQHPEAAEAIVRVLSRITVRYAEAEP